MILEKFSTKLQACINIFADCDRPEHNQEIVDGPWVWIKLQQLMLYANALKIDSQQNPTDFKLVPQKSPESC